MSWPLTGAIAEEYCQLKEDFRQYSSFPFTGSDDVLRLRKIMIAATDGQVSPSLSDLNERPNYWYLRMLDAVSIQTITETIVETITVGEEMSDDENQYWINQAALLDPKTYVFIENTTLTVPSGVNWQAIAWWAIKDLNGDLAMFNRIADATRPFTLPAGTVWEPADPAAHVYFSKPELVTGTDDRYATGQSARNLYFERRARLFTLPIFNLTAHLPIASELAGQVAVSFPSDFTYGLVTQCSNFDVSWTGLLQAAENGTMNLNTEVSDNHQQRISNVGFCPFARSEFPKIKARAASVQGNIGPTLSGYGNVVYHKLPTDW